MNSVRLQSSKLLRVSLLAGCVALAGALTPSAFGAPGAHGPNGEHLDAPTQPNGSIGSAPRFEASSEAFEMVGRLSGGELSMLINRYETNEPVTDAKVELETDDLRAVATFHKDHGDYAVDDEAFLEALSRPGRHPLVITLIAGNESDLLEGTLEVAQGAGAQGHAHDDEHGHEAIIGRSLLLIVGLSLLAALGWFASRRRSSVTGGVVR